MPHIITGEIRKAPYTKDGSNNNGNWKMYAVELSERMKVRNKDGQDETVYTNYRATFFAKENVMQWYNEAFQQGKVVSISCDTLQIVTRDGSDGTQYTHNEMIRPQLVFSQRDQQGGQQQGGWGQPQQPSGQQQPQRQQQKPQQQQNQFDDDIPF